jgi:hypothetical protein
VVQALRQRFASQDSEDPEGTPAWIQKTGNTEKATALMQRRDEHLKEKEFEEAEKTADSILKMMGVSTG